jgi:hypothetical protein
MSQRRWLPRPQEQVNQLGRLLARAAATAVPAGDWWIDGAADHAFL